MMDPEQPPANEEPLEAFVTSIADQNNSSSFGDFNRIISFISMKSTLVQQMQQLQQLVQRQQQQHPDPDKNVQQFIALARQNQMELMRNIQRLHFEQIEFMKSMLMQQMQQPETDDQELLTQHQFIALVRQNQIELLTQLQQLQNHETLSSDSETVEIFSGLHIFNV